MFSTCQLNSGSLVMIPKVPFPSLASSCTTISPFKNSITTLRPAASRSTKWDPPMGTMGFTKFTFFRPSFTSVMLAWPSRTHLHRLPTSILSLPNLGFGHTVLMRVWESQVTPASFIPAQNVVSITTPSASAPTPTYPWEFARKPFDPFGTVNKDQVKGSLPRSIVRTDRPYSSFMRKFEHAAADHTTPARTRIAAGSVEAGGPGG
mmetsp:Transcript_5728/g.13937  ORF Transcript_5728/g.13937 Transcript_5728/m.13937 type:complete len:206 (+) Transcript_5728:213-830(+)